MKSIKEKIIANIRPIGQIIGILIIFFIPKALNISDMVTKEPELKASQNWLDYVFYFVWNKGEIAIGLLLGIFVLFQIRKANKDCLFNRGDVYKNYPYWWYWVCAKILGYSECSLVLVPPDLQFKLVFKDTFTKYYCGEYEKKTSDTISVAKTNSPNSSDEVNIMIADTYPLQESQIPRAKRSKSTILISRDNVVDHNRYNSPELVKKVVNEVRNLPLNIKKINIYTTTNPQNAMKIAQDAFKLGERSSLDIITVFRQKRTGNRSFEKKGKIVYKR